MTAIATLGAHAGLLRPVIAHGFGMPIKRVAQSESLQSTALTRASCCIGGAGEAGPMRCHWMIELC